MLNEIEDIRQQALQAVDDAKDLKALDEVKVRFTGRRSRLRRILGGIGDLPGDQRPSVGQAAGKAQKQIADALEGRQEALDKAAESAAAIDFTLPGRPQRRGHTHPLSATADELVDALRQMGFSVADGPEVEDEHHNFDALNTPADHPARDEQDTFYLTDGRLLRTHTSTVQIRVMERQPPPVRVLSVGRCYRKESVDATHHMVFHQIEGLYVDRGVSMAELKGTLTALGRRVPRRRHEKSASGPTSSPSPNRASSTTSPAPSAAAGGGSDRGRCRVCKGNGLDRDRRWPALVDPEVFAAVGYDAERVHGLRLRIRDRARGHDPPRDRRHPALPRERPQVHAPVRERLKRRMG